MSSLFECFQPWKGPIPQRAKGVLISNNSGKATAYAIGTLQKRGTLFVSPGDEVYEGMIVGENSRDNDLEVNVTRAKQLTNVRASGADENIMITPAKKLTLETAIVYIEDDELVEITPRFIRLRKKNLKEIDRKRKSKTRRRRRIISSLIEILNKSMHTLHGFFFCFLPTPKFAIYIFERCSHRTHS